MFLRHSVIPRLAQRTAFRALCTSHVSAPALIPTEAVLTRGRFHLYGGYGLSAAEGGQGTAITNRKPQPLRYLLPRQLPLDLAVEVGGGAAFVIRRPSQCWQGGPSTTFVEAADGRKALIMLTLPDNMFVSRPSQRWQEYIARAT